MNTENDIKKIITLIAETAVASGLVNNRNCWNKRVKVAPQSVSFIMFGETPDANAWKISMKIASLRSPKKIKELLEKLASLTSSFKGFDGYELCFCKAEKYISIIIPDNEKYAA